MINYFGAGANRDQNRLAMVLGHEAMGGRGVLLKDFSFGYQLLNEIPEPAKEILQEAWGDDFRCYSVKKQVKASVVGRLWTLSEEDVEKMKEWEFVGTWKDWIEIKVCLDNGEVFKAYTEIIKDKYPLHGMADGLYYRDQINDRMPIRIKEDLAARDAELGKIRQQLMAMQQYRLQLRRGLAFN